jgi:hypothetical protein
MDDKEKTRNNLAKLLKSKLNNQQFTITDTEEGFVVDLKYKPANLNLPVALNGFNIAIK